MGCYQPEIKRSEAFGLLWLHAVSTKMARSLVWMGRSSMSMTCADGWQIASFRRVEGRPISSRCSLSTKAKRMNSANHRFMALNNPISAITTNPPKYNSLSRAHAKTETHRAEATFRLQHSFFLHFTSLLTHHPLQQHLPPTSSDVYQSPGSQQCPPSHPKRSRTASSRS